MSKLKAKVKEKLDIPAAVLSELLTPTEVRMLRNRWQMIKLLEEGLSIRQIAYPLDFWKILTLAKRGS